MDEQAKLVGDIRKWSAEMHRSADLMNDLDGMDEASKGTREVAKVLDRCLAALASPAPDGDVVKLLGEAKRWLTVTGKTDHVAERRAQVAARIEAFMAGAALKKDSK